MRVTYKLSLSRTTDLTTEADLTNRAAQSVVGDLVLLELGWPMVLKISGGRLWQTQSRIQHIDEGDLLKGQTVEVRSLRSVYQVRSLEERQV